MNFVPALISPRYFTFVVDNETTYYFLHDQTIGPELKQNTYLESDFLSSLSLAQLESLKMNKELMLRQYLIPNW